MSRALPAIVRAASRFACGVAFGLVIAIIALLLFESRGVLSADFLTQPPSGLPIGREGASAPRFSEACCSALRPACSACCWACPSRCTSSSGVRRRSRRPSFTWPFA